MPDREENGPEPEGEDRLRQRVDRPRVDHHRDGGAAFAIESN